MKNKKVPKQFSPVLIGESQKTSKDVTLQGSGRGFFYARRHLSRFNVSPFTPTFNFFKKTRLEFVTDLIFYALILMVAVSSVKGCTDPSEGHFGSRYKMGAS